MELLTGVTLQQGKYRIVRTLGRGGFGITYLAEQVLAKRMVCIKEFFPKDYYKRDGDSQHISLSSDGFRETMGRFKDKFLKEAQLIAGLDHPNIIRIHDLFEENGTAYYVMEYIDGESLHSLVSRRGALSEADAKGYIEQLAAALRHIHAHDIAHLDVKPGNIMVQTKDNRAVLIDFGLSKHYDVGGAQTSSTPVGISHGYAPMEQYQTGGVSTFSPGTDIYSMGATLYFLTVGKTPPTAAIVGEDGLGVLPSHLSESTRTAIERAMQLRRKDRPASVEEFLSLLHGASEDTSIELQPESELRATPSKPADDQPEPQPKRKGWWLWLLLLLAVVGVVCGIALSVGEDKEDDVVVTTELAEVAVISELEPEPVATKAETYNIGDYYSENGKQGVVFEVWDGGRHGKIVSLDETNGVWDSRVTWDATNSYGNGTRTYADTKSDGKTNTDKIMARSDSDYFPAFKWCRAKGSSWYLPAVDELNKIYNNKSVLNATLQKYGATLNDSWYWSSTEYVDYKPEFCAWYVNMGNGYTYYYRKSYDNSVRAVSAF
ncbi:MAG: protein kinase [Alistipes sp.]|nr:protein kinase [Alistipes sp.]